LLIARCFYAEFSNVEARFSALQAYLPFKFVKFRGAKVFAAATIMITPHGSAECGIMGAGLWYFGSS